MRGDGDGDDDVKGCRFCVHVSQLRHVAHYNEELNEPELNDHINLSTKHIVILRKRGT